MAGVVEPVESLIEIGFFQYILPFILMFAIYYGVLRKSNLFDKDNINSMIAFVAAAFTLYYAYQTETLQNFLSGFIAQAGIILIFALISGMISLFVFNILTSLQLDSRLLKLAVFFIIFYLVYNTAQMAGISEVAPSLSILVDEEAASGILLMILVIVGFSWIAGEGPTADTGS